MRIAILAALAFTACKTPAGAETTLPPAQSHPQTQTPPQTPAAAPSPARTEAPALIAALVQKHGEAIRSRAERGVNQVTAFWRAEDGDAAALRSFVEDSFVADP